MTLDELKTVREFVGADSPIHELLRKAIKEKILELRDVGNIPVDNITHEMLAQAFLAQRLAHDKLLEIFDGLGFGKVGELLNKRESTKESFR